MGKLLAIAAVVCFVICFALVVFANGNRDVVEALTFAGFGFLAGAHVA